MSEEEKGYRIKIENLSKEYGETSVLKNINLEIQPGEFVAIIGHSGCGKSTLLRLIAGLEEESEGQILLDEKKVSKIDPQVRYLFQEARLLPWKTVLTNVLLATPEKNEAKAAMALEKVGLINKKGNWPGTLSGGQKQRVALARALVGIPKLLLLDEPLGALDALTRLEMQDLIEGLWKEQKFTGILVTHDVSEAVRLADRVILMEDQTIKMDLKITLPRPRIKNNDSNYFEQLILSKVMHIDFNEERFQKEKPEYLI